MVSWYVTRKIEFCFEIYFPLLVLLPWENVVFSRTRLFLLTVLSSSREIANIECSLQGTEILSVYKVIHLKMGLRTCNSSRMGQVAAHNPFMLRSVVLRGVNIGPREIFIKGRDKTQGAHECNCLQITHQMHY